MNNISAPGSLNHPATTRLGPLINIPLVLNSLGHKPEAVLASAGFTLKQFEDPDTKIPFLEGSHLLAQCVKVTGAQNFGFLLGKYAQPSHLGIAGFLLKAAPNIESALNSLNKFLGLHDQGGRLILETNEKSTMLGYTITQNGVEASDQIYDLSTVMVCSIMRALCGSKWNPDEVFLTRNSPEDLTAYKLFFQAPIRFNEEKSMIVFNKGWLEHQIPSADPFLQRHLQEEAEKILLAQDGNFIDLLQELLQQCLSKQHCCAEQVATQLGIHERTLHRRLKLYGTSFRSELEQSRFTISRQLLTETNEHLLNIALSLGYSHTSAFSRAFKKWTGTSPTLWRNKYFKH